jgi:hypothetical protein
MESSVDAPSFLVFHRRYSCSGRSSFSGKYYLSFPMLTRVYPSWHPEKTDSPEPGRTAAVAETKDLTVEVDVSLIKRLKVYSAITGRPVKTLVSRWLDEKLPPLPQESEATA